MGEVKVSPLVCEWPSYGTDLTMNAQNPVPCWKWARAAINVAARCWRGDPCGESAGGFSGAWREGRRLLFQPRCLGAQPDFHLECSEPPLDAFRGLQSSACLTKLSGDLQLISLFE